MKSELIKIASELIKIAEILLKIESDELEDYYDLTSEFVHRLYRVSYPTSEETVKEVLEEIIKEKFPQFESVRVEIIRMDSEFQDREPDVGINLPSTIYTGSFKVYVEDKLFFKGEFEYEIDEVFEDIVFVDCYIYSLSK